MEHILSLSYGKDSLACLGAIEELGWPLDRIVHAEVWATDTIPADLPPMLEFKEKADQIIKERWGIGVEHIRYKYSYKEYFYQTGSKGKYKGIIHGFPMTQKKICVVQQAPKNRSFAKISKNRDLVFRNCCGRAKQVWRFKRNTKIPYFRGRMGRGILPKMVRRKRPSFSYIHYRNPWRMLVLP